MSRLIVHVAGARPNFPKLAPVVRALEGTGIDQRIVHTGQHYDDAMSAIFFRDLELPDPDVNLEVGSGSHATQTAQMMTGLERTFLEQRPDLVIVYGDVNSTVAAALVAAKLGIPVAHVEAGLRSFDWTMPEEINRVVTDRLSTLLFATSADAIAHLGHEGVPAERIHLVGNPMIDTLLAHRDRLDASAITRHLDTTGPYGVLTLHRPGNVDDPAVLSGLAQALSRVADQIPLVLPIHPRGRARLAESGLFEHPGVHVTEPLGYLEFLSLVSGAELVVTDSGGIQEETTILGVPCFTLRPNTERPVTITHGTNRLVTPADVDVAVRDCLAAGGRREDWPVPPLWDGDAGSRIAKVIVDFLG